MTNDSALTLHPGMPVMDIQLAGQRRSALVEFTKSIMVSGKDYGIIPGTGDKPTLLKPGAEKLTTFFGLAPRFELVDRAMDWTGIEHGGEPFFYLQYRCELYRDGVMVGSGVGSCNSWEKKYRYRKGGRSCPNCGSETINKSKYPPRNNPNAKPGWYCYAKIGGCGMEFAAGDPAIEQQEAGQVKNENPADQVNTIDKMAQKRALVAATLIAVNASEFFTQDIEDMNFGDVVEGEYTESPPPAQATQSKAKPAPQAPPPQTDKPKADPLMIRFHELGQKLWPDNWDEKRGIMVADVTDGKSASSKDLSQEQLGQLVADMAQMLNERLAGK
jgi:hypothetical protein